MKKSVELLAPAQNSTFGIEAINHGADAVYIGAPKFGARVAAGNSIEEIEKMCHYAHLYHANVYVALNTILNDNELEEAEVMIRQLHEAGADGLIIQDMGILMLPLPPMPIHASTQTDNRTLEQIRFLEEAGISRIILARELSIPQIKEIKAGSSMELEAFVHGALCVSFSGRCYISQSDCGRSANRGECAQYCRLPYSLIDSSGKTLIKEQHLLSLKDMNRSASLKEMLDAGICSFKIEGRLKELSYIKNVTAFYRQQLDHILESDKNLQRTSSGKSKILFQPNPAKSFNRGFTDYFLHERTANMTQPHTPKSLGEEVGKVSAVYTDSFTVNSNLSFVNGDGFCYLNKDNELEGFNINRVNGDRLYPAKSTPLYEGVLLYRNEDHIFEKMLKTHQAVRKIGVKIGLSTTAQGFRMQYEDEDGFCASVEMEMPKDIAHQPEKAIFTIREQLSKLGNTIFEATEIVIDFQEPYFIVASQLAKFRRECVEQLMMERLAAGQKHSSRIFPVTEGFSTYFKEKKVTYHYNVMNRKAEQFYRYAGATEIEPALEKQIPAQPEVMFCRYCILYELGCCNKEKTKTPLSFPLFLKLPHQQYRLIFDCKNCIMTVIQEVVSNAGQCGGKKIRESSTRKSENSY